MRSQALSRVVGAVIVGGAWLSGACGSSFISAPSEDGGSGGQAIGTGGRSSGGAPSGEGGAHSGKAGNGSGGYLPAQAGRADVEAGAAGSEASGTGGAPHANAGSAGLNHGGGGGTSGGGTSGGGTSGGGTSGGGTSGGGTSGGGTSGGGTSGGGTSGAPACLPSAMTWSGCQALTCGACSSAVSSYPLYFTHHPTCTPIVSCPSTFSACGAACPPPSSADLCDGTPGQWNGCRGNGCYVCAELVTNYPKYFEHHPGCVKNGTCMGVFATCNENCPAPVAADI
jgi:hypothetical protein